MASLEAASKLNEIPDRLYPDLIYLDASHDTESVYADLCAWYPFVQGHGILCGDDWTWDSVRIAVYRFANERHLNIEASVSFWRLVE